MDKDKPTSSSSDGERDLRYHNEGQEADKYERPHSHIPPGFASDRESRDRDKYDDGYRHHKSQTKE